MKTLLRREDIFSVILHVTICTCLLAGIFLLYYYYPVAYIYFVTEDSWVEYGSFVFYILASLLVAGAIKNDRQLMRPGYVLLCLGLFIIGMEEISWGQRLLGVRTPYIIAQYNYQSEISIHNLFIFPKEYFFYYAVMIWALFFPIISHRYKHIQSFFMKTGVPFVSYKFLPYFIFSFFFLNFKVIIDNDEIGETFLGLAFTLFAFDIFYRTLKNGSCVVLAKRQIAGFLILIALMLTSVLTLMKPGKGGALRSRLLRTATVEYPQRGLNDQALKVFHYTINHKELRSDQTLLQYGLFLQNIHSPNTEVAFLEALQEQRREIQLHPNQPKPHRIAGKIYKLLNQNSLAKKEFQTALIKDQNRLPRFEASWHKAKVLRSMGETYVEMGNDKLALQHFQKAYQLVDGGWKKGKIKNLIKMIKKK